VATEPILVPVADRLLSAVKLSLVPGAEDVIQVPMPLSAVRVLARVRSDIPALLAEDWLTPTDMHNE
jgi:hypothetical protein